MRRYWWERTDVVHGPLQVVRDHQVAEAAINEGRTRGLIDGSETRRGWRQPGGVHADCLSGSYSWLEGRPTETLRTWPYGVSVLGLVWWLAPDESVHYRIAGEVMSAPDYNSMLVMLRPWGLTSGKLATVPQHTLVYPELYVPNHVTGGVGVRRNLLALLRDDPLDAVAWGILGDWCEDHGEEVMRLRCRAASERLEMLAPHLE